MLESRAYRNYSTDKLLPKRIASGGEVVDKRTTKLPGMTWKDHLVMLLHNGAEIEHSLMVQYLFAAYTMGGEEVPVRHRVMVRHWQESILAVAKEEMGHLLTVQNVLTLMGAPINLQREDLPWDTSYYPFTFHLEPLTLNSVASYVFAEMPSESELEAALKDKKLNPYLRRRYVRFRRRDRRDIERRVSRISSGQRRNPHRVGELYDELIELVGDADRIPDQVFQEHTYSHQASFDDWGRGYRPDPMPVEADGSLKTPTGPSIAERRAHVLIDRVATRTEVLAALHALALQGEAPVLAHGKGGVPLSHFDRFLEIYQEMKDLEPDMRRKRWGPSRDVAPDPTTVEGVPVRKGYIRNDHTRIVADLFNLRYRMLLKYLAHSFRLAHTEPGDRPNLRAMVMHRVFGEMYNLKTLASLLVRLPLHPGPDPVRGHRAGPPFEIPYALELPDREVDAWAMHQDLLASAQRLCRTICPPEGRRGHPDPAVRDYANALFDIDQDARKWVETILAGLGVTKGALP